MTLLNPTRYPLGLTRGSVRAVIAIVITIAAVAALLASLARAELPAAAAALVMLAQAVVRDYFDDRRTAPAPAGTENGSDG